MAYLLDLLVPGLGHLAARLRASGLALLLLWSAGLVLGLVGASFDLFWLAGLGAWHVALALGAAVHLARRSRASAARRPGALRSVALLAFGALLAAGLLFATTTFLARPVTIRSGSMEPGIWTGDTIVAQLFWPMLGAVGLGDIVLVANPARRGQLLLKRVVGLAGDLVEVRDGEIRRNGRPLAECALRELTDPESGAQVVERLEVLGGRPYLVWDQPARIAEAMSARVPAGQLFVLGDNRDRSGDSRSFGPVPVSAVRARVRVSAAPPRSRVDLAPVAARRAAFARCSGRR